MALNVVRIKINRAFIANLGGRSVPYAEGTEAKMPMEDALEYQRSGYITILDAMPQVKIKNRPAHKQETAVK